MENTRTEALMREGGAFAPARICKPVARGNRGVVAAQNMRAARIGVDILEAGGNAFDAAIAVSFALGVVEPWMSGLGGIGCGVIRDGDSGEIRALDFGAVAPAGLDPEAYPITGGSTADLFGWPAVHGDRNLEGALSICVPGELDGLRLLHEHFATLPWKELVAPAIRLAREGLEIDWWSCLVIAAHAVRLRRFSSTAEIFLPDGLPPAPGMVGEQRLVPLGRLADTLDSIAEQGPRDFYEGDIAEALLADLRGQGSFIGAGDLRAYRARLLPPLSATHGRSRAWTVPGPFAGVSFQRCLALLQQAGGPADRGEAESYLRLAEVLKRVYGERLAFLGDGECTSHLCVIDRHGNLVSLTRTLLSVFGSRLLLPKTGILPNNGIYWFDPCPGRANSMAPGKRPLSNMCPVIGEHGKRRIALGASGGRRILPAVLQLFLDLAEHGMELERALHAPRIDVSGSERVLVDPRLPTGVRSALACHHETLEYRPRPWPLGFACPVAAVEESGADGRCAGAEPFQPWAGGASERSGEETDHEI